MTARILAIVNIFSNGLVTPSALVPHLARLLGSGLCFSQLTSCPRVPATFSS